MQGPSGCAEMQWRTEEGGYLREILMSRVYDVAIETPLEPAARLSEALGNTVFALLPSQGHVPAVSPACSNPHGFGSGCVEFCDRG